MTDKIYAKNVEIYLGTVAVPGSFDPSAKANDESYADYLDSAITASTVTNFTKISSRSNEFSIEPSEDKVETKDYFGSTSTGAQNSDTVTNINSDVDIKLTVDSLVVDSLVQFGLTQESDTHSDYTNYKAYILGNTTTDQLVLLIRIKRLIGSIYYYRNILIDNPIFKSTGGVSGSSDDTVLTTDFSLLGNKSTAYIDFYSGSVNESLSNI